MDIEREQMEFDVLFVGGGPACLASAIRLMQSALKNNLALEVALIEKGGDMGAHALSGAVMNPMALHELVPDFNERSYPLENLVRGDEFHFLTAKKAWRMPMTPPQMHNQGFHIISISKLTAWLAGIAEELGVNIFPGFAGTEVLFGEDQKTVIGVRTDDKGLDPQGEPKGSFEPGIDLLAKVTVFGEGASGSLTQSVAERLGLFEDRMPQIFETGIKEIIQLPKENYFQTSKGNDIHTLGYPLGLDTPGGGFIYQMADDKVALGYLIALGYQNPLLDLYDEFLKFKQHPFVANIIKGGKVLEQGARTVPTGGYYTLCKLAADGAVFVGAGAGFHNAPALKGIHVSMKSGMLAADAIVRAWHDNQFTEAGLRVYQDLFETSWLKTELYAGRNFAQALDKKGLSKFFHLGAQQLSKGRGFKDPMPITADAKTLKPSDKSTAPAKSNKEMVDGELYVDKLTGVYLSKTMHREDEPCHLKVHDTQLCIETCWPTYQSPCTRFCPGDVYEITGDEKSGERQLKLNPSNCLHCKTCEIKDPYSNITWTCPEGGEGPGYTMM